MTKIIAIAIAIYWRSCGGWIMMNEDNTTVGIVVYVEDDIQETKKIPGKLYDKNLGEYKVFIKKISEASDFEKEKMIIYK